MEELKQVLYGEIEGFRETGHKFINGELNLMQFKHSSGGFGVYAHRGGKEFMIRLRIPSGVTDIGEMEKVYEFAERYGLDKIHLTTRQAIQLHGKELSYNNIGDTDGALETLKEFREPTVVAAKHANPCGVGSAQTITEAYLKAYEADPVSIFGGIVAANREIDKDTATEMAKIFLEVIIAPSFSKEALDILSKKKKGARNTVYWKAFLPKNRYI